MTVISFLTKQNSQHPKTGFKTNVSHQYIVYKITFVNSKHENTNSREDFELKKGV